MHLVWSLPFFRGRWQQHKWNIAGRTSLAPGNYLQLSCTVQDASLIAKPWGCSQCGESVGTLLSSQSQLMHAEASCTKHTQEYARGYSYAMSSRATKGPCMRKGSFSAIHQMALLAAAIWPCRPTLCSYPHLIPSLSRYTTYPSLSRHTTRGTVTDQLDKGSLR